MNCVYSDFHGDGENWECPVKGDPISEGVYFHFGPILKKVYELLTLGLQSLGKDSGFKQLLEDRTEVKIPFDIKPPLTAQWQCN